MRALIIISITLVIIFLSVDLFAEEIKYNFDNNTTNIPVSCQDLYDEFLRYKNNSTNPKYKIIAKRFDDRLLECVIQTERKKVQTYMQFRSTEQNIKNESFESF